MRRSLSSRTLSAVSALVSLCLAAGPAHGQAKQEATPSTPGVAVAAAQPRPEDVATVDGIVKAFYETISGPAGQPRQWARDRTLYIPGVRFVAMSVQNGKPVASIMDHQTYVDRMNVGFVKSGFFEREIHRVARGFGHITHVFSTYEWRTTPDGPVGGRGVNSLELFHDGTRWWIAAAVWDEERPDSPLPKEFLP